MGTGTRRRARSTRYRRVTIRVALLATVTLLVTVGVPAPDLARVGRPVHLSWSSLLSWLAPSAAWASPWNPHTPRQQGGSAAGLPHTTPATATRAGGGAGRPPGKGAGQLPAFSLHPKSTKTSTTGPAIGDGSHSFNPTTSKRLASSATANSNLYRNTDGTYTRTLSAAPLNYQGSDGAWHAIAPSLARAADGRIHVAAGQVGTDFAARADDPSVISLRLDAGHTIGYGLQGAAAVVAVVSGTRVTYPQALPLTDLVFDSLPAGVEESLILDSPAAPSSWVFPLALSGLKARIVDGSVEFIDASGSIVGVMPPSTMWDSQFNPASGGFTRSRAITYSLITVDGRPALRMTADTAWLHDPSRAYPVTVDPSYTATTTGNTAVYSDFTCDCSGDYDMDIGTWNNGQETGNSFLQFANLGPVSGQQVTSASLKVFDYWASTCTPERFDVAAVTQSWSVTGSKSYPGPSRGPSIGNLTANPGAACTNTAGNSTVGVWMNVTLSTATFNTWTTGGANYGLTMYGSTTGTLTWKRFDTIRTSNPPQLILNYTPNQLPQVDTMYPPTNYNATTLTPELIALGHDPDAWPAPVKYTFTVYSSAGATLASSGLISANSWVVPPGKLTWSQTYFWSVLAYDGVAYSSTTSASYFTTTVPQPLITSGLAQNTGQHGFDPSAGNYTASVTDAQEQTVGPSLSVQRDYNSLDPRMAQAFGAGWSSLYDMRATEVPDATGAVTGVIITYPSGEEVEFGRNSDGSFAPPQGRYATLTSLAPGYKLVDKSDTTYTFTVATGGSGGYALSAIADFQGRTESLTYSAGLLSVATSGTSGRSLNFTWATPSGATAPHVSTVVTDPVVTGTQSTALTWTYSYTGDRLTKVCSPTSSTACAQYAYTDGSHFRTTVIDAGPRDYWRLSDPAGTTTAADQMLINENTLNGTYTTTSMAGTPGGPLSDGLTSATFNGSTGAVSLPSNLINATTYLSIGLWFKTTSTATGTLVSTGNSPPGTASPSSAATPLLYVGSDGKLHGHFWNGAASGITSTASVNDGGWHYVVLTGAGNTQSLYLDGSPVGSPLSGQIANSDPLDMIGAGVYNNNGWPAAPSGTTWNYFTGQIAEVAYYTHPLTATVIAAQWSAAGHQANLLTSITRPSGKIDTTVAYHTSDDTVDHLTDINGGTWTIGPASVTGSSQTYAGAVMGSAPQDYWRLGETGVSQAVNQVRGGTATYNNVTLGVTGAFGAGDDPAASFNGTSSYVSLPSGLFPAGPSSQELWFSTTGTNRILLSAQQSAMGSTTCPCLPVLWITSDGKLRALSPSTSPSGPFAAKSLSGKCMDLSAGDTDDGTKVQVWDCQNGNANQNWTLYPDGSVRNFGKCLDLSAYGTTNGTKVQLWDCTGASNQVWQPYNGGLRNPVSGRCLDDPSSSLTNGTQFQLYDCNGTNAQQWVQGLVTTNAVNDGAWHHAVLTTDGKAQWLYLDGVLASTATGSTTGSFTLTPGALPYTYLGTGYNGTTTAGLPANTTGYFTGSLDEAAFYPSTLSAADVSRHWAEYKSAFGVAPVQTVQVTDPGNHVTTYRFDPQNGNRPLSTTDGLGNKTTYGYDTSGFLHTVTDPDGDVTTTGHDVRGNMVSQTTCQNQVNQACSTAYYTYYPDDTSASPPPDQRNDLVLTVRDGRSTSATDNRYVTTYTYDAAGNGTSVTTPPVPGYPAGRTSITVFTDGHTQAAVDTGFAPAGLVASASTPGGAIETVSYFHNGDPAKVVDPAGAATTYTYDGLGRVLTKTVVTDSYPAGLTTSYTYDGQNRPLAITDPPITDRVTGAIHTARTSDVYDVDGGTLSTTVTDLTGGDAARSVSNTFDSADRVATATNAAGNTTTYTYDVYGNRASETDAAGNRTTYAYDANGHLLTTTLKSYTGDPVNPSAPVDLVESSRAYDPAGRLASITDSMGWATAYTYTDNGLTASITRKDPSSGTSFVQQSNAYDAAGNLATRVTNNGTTTTSYAVDAAGRASSVALDPTGLNRVTSYTYGPDDFITAIRVADASGTAEATDTTYDALGRITSRTVHDDTAGHPSGWWQLGDGAGTVAADSSGAGQIGTLTSGVTWSPGAATFNGTSGAITTPGPVLNTAASFSVSAWVKLATAGSAFQTFVSQDGTTNSGFYLQYDPTDNRWALSTNSADSTGSTAHRALSPAAPVTGVWTHLVGVYNSASNAMTLYVNGVAGTTTTTSAAWNAIGSLAIGRGKYNGSATDWTTASIADVQVYGRAVSASEAAALYANGGSGATWAAGPARYATATGPISVTAGTVATGTGSSFSVSAWVKPTTLSGYPAVVSQSGTTGAAYQLAYSKDDRTWRFTRPDSDSSSPATWYTAEAATTPALIGTWTHLVGVFDAGTGKLSIYVNGVLAGTSPALPAGAQWSSTGPLVIGAANYNGSLANILDGQVAGVQMFARALSTSDITKLYQASAAGVALNATLQTTRWTLDQRGLPTSVTDPLGNITTYSNDESGKRVVSVSPAVTVEVSGTQAVPSTPTTMVGYDTFGEPVETSDANGNTSITGYDAAGRIVSSTMPSYTPPGSGTAITPVATRTYNNLGQLASVTDALNHTTTYTYDQLGDAATATDPSGGLTHSTYDTDGDRLSTADPTGAQIQATYDYLGRQLTATQLVRQGSAVDTTTNAYATTGGYLSAITSAAGVISGYTYDALGEVTSASDGAGHVTTMRYDALGRTVGTTQPDGTSHTTSFDEAGNQIGSADLNATGTTLRTSSASYDADGHPIASTDPLGNTTTFSYDASGALTRETQPVAAGSSITTSFGYDAVGNPTRFTDGRGNSFMTTYNSWNLPESSIEPSTTAYPSGADRTFTAAYNAVGQPVSQTSPGGVVVTNAYDSRGDLTAQTGTGADAPTTAHTYGYDAAGRITSVNATGTNDTFGYDDRGLLLSASGPSGASSFTYNADGQMTARTDASGTSGYTYDGVGRVHTIADGSTATTLTYGYDTDSQLTSVNYGQVNRVYTYNSLHQLTGDTLTNPSGGTEASISYGYDLDGNETSKTTTGFAGSTTNTYTYDQAGRLSSWNNGATTVAYGYDASGNRTQVGSKTFAYNERNELTSDGTSTYAYTSRGTLASTTTGSVTTQATSDAFNRVITDGAQSYTYDGLDRLLTGSGYSFSYSGAGNDTASDGTFRYSRTPGGSLIGVGHGTSSVLAMTDQHTDVVGNFTASGATLAGSVSYDPFGAITAASTMLGNLGYQSGWTDPGTSKVDMAARWYNPATGQFTSRDTASNPPAPNPVAANRFQYGNDNPLIGTDPTGHCDWWNVVCNAQQAVSTVKQAATSTWNTVTTAVSTATTWVANTATNFYHAASSFVSNAWNSAVHLVTTAVHTVVDAYNNVKTWVSNTVTNTVNLVKQAAKTAWNAAVYTVQHPVEAFQTAAQTAGTFLKAHAADIASFIASTAVFMGCEAALGVVTAGVGAVAGAVACGALAGAVGSAVTYGMTTPMSKWDLGDAAKAVGIGALTGAAGSLLGAAGGKLVATFGSKILGPVLDSVASRLGPAALDDAAATVAEDVTETAAKDVTESATSDLVDTAAEDANAAGPHGGGEGEPAPEGEGASCSLHSFDPSTPVLMADGSSKPIGTVKLGDKVESTDPATGKSTAEPVVVLHDNHDTDLADVTVKSSNGKTTTLHTTWHHPFWNETDRKWTDAAELKPGTALHVWDGDNYAVKVVSVKTWTGLHDMHDLTVAQIHTYYVMAGATPVLVHNCGEGATEASPISGPKVYRAPRAENGQDELTNGLNPARHQTGDRSAYVGDEDVAQQFAGQPGYEHGYIEFEMHPDFEAEFAPYKFDYDGSSSYQWQIPQHMISRFNELTVNRTWINYYQGYKW